LIIEGGELKSFVNGEEYRCGLLDTPSLDELNQELKGKQINLHYRPKSQMTV